MFPTPTVVVRFQLVFVLFSLGHIDGREQGDTTGMKLSLAGLSLGSRKQSPVPPPKRDDPLLATHPSDHDAVYVQGISHTGRKRRVARARQRKRRELGRSKKRQVGREACNRDRGLAFLVSVPLSCGYGFPSGVPHGPGGGCAGVGTHLLPFLFVMI